MSIESAFSFFIAVLIFGVTPGPGVFAVLARALASDAHTCWWLAFGMTISDMLYLIAACFGLAVIAQQWSEVFTVVRVLGALYLLYLGWKIWTAPVEFDTEQVSSNASRGASFLQGFLISASNPKVILFYIAFLPTFMDVEALSAHDIVLASVLTIIALMVGMMAIAFTAAQARLFFKSKKAMKNLNRSAGSIMIGAAAYLATRQSS